MAEKIATAISPALGVKAKGKDKGKDEHRDSLRELAETVVFVVVLVLMLKTFVAEAFVIPTGSMAETLYGYHKMVTCEKCGFVFPLNCHYEVEENQPALDCICPNCQHAMHWKDKSAGPSWSSGDRVLVAKFLFDNNHFWQPKRHNVFVFKYPGQLNRAGGVDGGPQKGNSAMNYIKRCEGLPGETIAVFDGDLYVTKSLNYPPPGDPKDTWKDPNMRVNDERAVQLFDQSLKRHRAGQPAEGDFQIIRKPLSMLLDVRRIVYDNDHQPSDLADKPEFQRWRLSKDSGWKGDSANEPKTFTHYVASDGTEQWLEYRHILRSGARYSLTELASDGKFLISNALAYNSGANPDGEAWVGDLMLDCTVKVTDAQGELVFELAKGIDRFQARFDLASGDCSLVRLTGKLGEQQEKQELGKQPTKLKKAGSYHVRFANFDERLTVWVDRELPFGDGLTYSPAKETGPIGANDLLPARIGVVKGGVAISHLQLWRDIFYTAKRGNEPAQNGPLTMYVPEEHYLALGDNSSSSADSRSWGLVPERLLLGRALAIYFPFWPWNQRAGLIH